MPSVAARSRWNPRDSRPSTSWRRRGAACARSDLADGHTFTRPLVHDLDVLARGHQPPGPPFALNEERDRRSRQLHSSSVIRRQLLAFVVANGFALLFTFGALSQAWLADVDDVPRSLVTRWLPFALILASLLTATVAVYLDDTKREGFLLRHFALFLSVPAVLLFLRLGPVSNGELGVIYVGIAFALALHALAGVWSALDQIDDRRVALLLGASLLAVGLIVLPYARTVVPTAPDDPHYLIATQSR